MVSLTAFLVAVSSVVFVYLFFKKDRNKKLPPGPMSLPIIGNALALRKGPHVQFCEWAAKYGNIFQFKLGMESVIVISDMKMIQEAFNDQNLSGRPDLESFNILSDGPHGVINSSGEEWVEQRRFTLRHLRDFGFGKNYLESTIMEEVNELLDSFKQQEGQPIAVSRKFSLAILNSLWQILTSKRYKQDDPRLLDIFLQNAKINDDLGNSPAIFLPKLAKLVPKYSGWDRVVSLVKEMQAVVIESVEEHKSTFPEDGNPRDFVDAYLKEMRATTNPNSSFYKDLGETSIKAVISDLFGAGAETTSSTLNWSILFLSKFPKVQAKMQEEIDNVVGKNRQPSLEDRPNLPYVCATMEEVLRHSSLVPFGLFHTATVPVKFHDYDIPKGTWIIGNFYGVHYDDKIFENPEQFKPERYLVEKDGKQTFKKSEAVMAFSVGKRACLGETLARDEYYLFLASIFQKFTIQLAPESKDVSLTAKPGFLLQPQAYNVVMKERLVN